MIPANALIPATDTVIAKPAWSITAKAVQRQIAARMAKSRKTGGNQPDRQGAP